MSSGAVAIPLLAFCAVSALAWGAWAWVGRGRLDHRRRVDRWVPAVPPAEGREGSVAASPPDEEPRPVSRGGWSLDLSDES
jgi:hypothetical protein